MSRPPPSGLETPHVKPRSASASASSEPSSASTRIDAVAATGSVCTSVSSPTPVPTLSPSMSVPPHAGLMLTIPWTEVAELRAALVREQTARLALAQAVDEQTAKLHDAKREAKRLRRERDSARLRPRTEGKERRLKHEGSDREDGTPDGALRQRSSLSLASSFCPLPRDSARPTLRQLIDANADLRAELDARNEERDSALLRVEQLQREGDELLHQLTSLQAVGEQEAGLAQELESLPDKATVLSREVEQLKDEKEQFRGEREHAQHQLRAAEEQAALLTQANAALRDMASTLYLRAESLRSEGERVGGELEKAKADIDSSSRQFASLSMDLHASKEETAALAHERDALLQQTAAFSARLHDADKQLDVLSKERDALLEKAERREGVISYMERLIHKQEDELRETDTISAELCEEKKRIAHLLVERDEERERQKHVITQMEARFAVQEEQLQQTTSDLLSAQLAGQSAAERDVLSDEVRLLVCRCNALRDENDAQAQKIGELEKAAAERQLFRRIKIPARPREAGDAQTEVAAVTAERDELHRQLHAQRSVQDDRVRLPQRLEGLEDENRQGRGKAARKAQAEPDEHGQLLLHVAELEHQLRSARCLHRKAKSAVITAQKAQAEQEKLYWEVCHERDQGRVEIKVRALLLGLNAVVLCLCLLGMAI
ncbi:hypothetical protein HMN09_01176800 [Mycena chlorophos]|uniref:Uncharacterized protein n=1 Tax=Mycena chlorophos TaxID=658473 RepID=A0A8H6S650_MYCCL|nr:hypothetical protein HMN09_01176800 [Mycena chlorophos]